jgi:muramoyltetrapeptide carboxypeptidase
VIKARALRSGDRVAIVAPASKFDRDEFQSGVDEVRRLGFEPVFDDEIFASSGYVAGSATHRAAALMDAVARPDVAGILCARGGYGSAQLLPHLDAAAIAEAAKPLVGYSDVTTLLAFVTGQAGLVAFHGPMVAGPLARGAAGYDRDTFLRALTGEAPLGEVAAGTLAALQPGEAAGPLLGGTLTQLVASLGTPWAFDPPPGHVLFLDEVNERPYRLDRMLTQCAQAGLLARAAGIVFGELPGCDEPGGTATAIDALRAALDGFPGPIAVGLPAGHVRGAAITLPLGVRARLAASATHARLVIEEGGVVGW